VALSGCTYNDEICFIGIGPTFIVCLPARYKTETVSKLSKERTVIAVDKDMYTWVSSANK